LSVIADHSPTLVVCQMKQTYWRAVGGATMQQRAVVSAEEVSRFNALAADWWQPDGPMRPLHRMNPARIAWITERATRHFTATAGLCLLDVGCGAGLAAEALARRGFDVLGLDAAADAIDAARAHAAGQGLSVSYRLGVAEDLLAEGRHFPVITALEVIEHVPDPGAFLTTLAGLLEPGGMLFLSTLNRTPQSFLAAKVAAEYLLRWLPVGTHDWRRFITPVELGSMLRGAGLRVADSAGLAADPLTGLWRSNRNLAVNYLIAAKH
jgi:2-polyprenyl-6-hydroxyphenyl methylase/3-demethylubiquinone-9 3-methyltransferase